jgi:hypothetical protein
MATIVAERVKKEGRPVEPRAGQAAVYRTLQDRFNSLWRSLKGEFIAHRAGSN